MCVMDFGGSWEKYLPLVEFAYNNNYHSTIGMGHMRHSMDENIGHLLVGWR